MENQHRLIGGYRDLSEGEIDLVNRIKEVGQEVGDLLGEIEKAVPLDAGGFPRGADGRWLAIAQTHLQQGFMALVRAVAKPEGF